MPANLLATHHIFMLTLAGLAFLHQRLLSRTLFRSSPCEQHVFGYPFGEILRLTAHHRFDLQLFGETPVSAGEFTKFILQEEAVILCNPKNHVFPGSIAGKSYGVDMRVEIRLFASLRKYGLPQEQMELPEGSTVANLLERIGIPTSEVAITLVNGRNAQEELPLKDGEILALFPPIAGG